MRNLKRALSLALASVMLMGMMVVGTGAAFKDESKIVNKDAAATLTALDIMIGTGDNFEPTKTVTRAEMALILCKATQVPAALIDSNANTVVFDDVAAGKWYTGAIAVAAEKGWVVGYPDGNFGYKDTVTTAQAALMIQKALGYWVEDDATVGNKVSLANTKAYEIGMMNDLVLSANVGLSRDNVAGMVYNAMTETVPVVYSADKKGYVLASDGVTPATKTALAEAASIVNDPKEEIVGTNLISAFELEVDTKTTDALGRATTTYKKDDKVVFVVADEAEYTFNGVVSAEDVAKAMKVDADDVAAGTFAGATGANKVVEVFDKTDAADYIAYTYVAATVESVESETEEGVTTTTVTLDDDATYVTTSGTDLEEGDIVVYVAEATAVADEFDGTIATIEVAKTDAGEITAMGTGYIRLDGVKYVINNGSEDVTVANGNKGVVVLDPNGDSICFIVEDGTAASTDYALVTEIRVASDAATGKDAGYADMILADGTKVTVALDMEADNAPSGDVKSAEDTYNRAVVTTYTEKDGLYTLATMPTNTGKDATVSDVSIANGSRTVGTDKVDFETIFVDIEAGVVYTGIEKVASYTDSETNEVSVIVADGSVAPIVYILSGETDDSDAETTYVYVATDANEVDGDGVYTYTDVYVDGVKTEIVSKNGALFGDDFSEAGLYKITKVDANGNASLTAEQTTFATMTSADAITSKAIYDAAADAGIEFYTYDKNTVVIVVADGKATASSVSKIVLAKDLEDKDKYSSLKVVADDDDYASYIIITEATYSTN